MIDKLKESPEKRTLYLVTGLSAFFVFVFEIILYDAFYPITEVYPINYFAIRFDFEFGGSQNILFHIYDFSDAYYVAIFLSVINVDYFYLVARSVLLFCLALIVTRIFSNRSYYGDIGYKITIFPLIAGIVDIIENVVTTLLLNNFNTDFNLSAIVFTCATIKFILILITILWIVFGTLMTLAIKSNYGNYALDVQ